MSIPSSTSVVLSLLQDEPGCGHVVIFFSHWMQMALVCLGSLFSWTESSFPGLFKSQEKRSRW